MNTSFRSWNFAVPEMSPSYTSVRKTIRSPRRVGPELRTYNNKRGMRSFGVKDGTGRIFFHSFMCAVVGVAYTRRTPQRFLLLSDSRRRGVEKIVLFPSTPLHPDHSSQIPSTIFGRKNQTTKSNEIWNVWLGWWTAERFVKGKTVFFSYFFFFCR